MLYVYTYSTTFLDKKLYIYILHLFIEVRLCRCGFLIRKYKVLSLKPFFFFLVRGCLVDWRYCNVGVFGSCSTKAIWMEYFFWIHLSIMILNSLAQFQKHTHIARELKMYLVEKSAFALDWCQIRWGFFFCWELCLKFDKYCFNTNSNCLKLII